MISFSEQLNQYLDQLGCTAQELSDVSGVSAAVISRYRSGSRIPSADSPQINLLAHGISLLAQKQNVSLTEADALARFQEILKTSAPRGRQMAAHLDALLSACPVSLAELSRALNYDSSYLSRIRSGSRTPSDPEAFCRETARILSRRLTAETVRQLAILTESSPEELADPDSCTARLAEWLLSDTNTNAGPVRDFLEKLDQFDLNDYIRSIHFDELKVPTSPISFPTSRSYYGIPEFMNGELDFLKATVLSKSMEPVVMYSDMPIEEMSKDPDFPKKWMFGMAMMLKKGLHLDMIHNIDRPFYEMMLGLESWIPMYMTGQISPYYLNSVQNSIFCHFLKVSGSVALWGEAIAGSHENGRYYLTKKKDEVSYYKRRAADMKAHARPLMKIYRADSAAQFRQFFMQNRSSENCRGILGSLPLYTLDKDCLEAILSENRVSPAAAAQIREEVLHERQFMETFLTSAQLSDEVPLLSQTEFQAHPMKLFLADLFLEDEISYSWETYKWHMELTRQFADTHAGYQLKTTSSAPFLNIQIRICEGRFVVVSKNSSPAIQFVIHHPKLCRAIETMITPIVD